MSRKLSVFLAISACMALTAGCQGTDDPGQGDGLASISGALTVDDVPAADVRIYVLGMPQLDDRTDGNGEFQIIGIPAGTHTLVAADGVGHGLQFEATAQDGAEQRVGTLPLRETGAIAGVVTVEGLDDATGTDVYVPGSSFLAKTDAAGRFFILEVPAGRYTLRAERDEYRPAEVAVEVTAGGVGEAFLTLRRDCVPRAEICDGLDNDCDGEVDEDSCDADPVLVVQPDFVDFGAVEVGATASATVALLNPGGGDLVLQAVSLSAASDAAFSLAGGTALPVTLAPGQVLELTLAFAPGAPGRYSGALAVGGASVTANVALLGVGTEGCTPELELCNGIDDDCDGMVDENACDDPCEGVSCAAGEVCDAGECHDPCWDQVCADGEICNPLYGLCEPACDDLDGDGFCSDIDCDDRDPMVFPGGPEACGDGLDNDCDGLVDEDCFGCAPGETMTCGPQPVGACASGAIVCQADGTWGQCEGAAWPEPEVCDGIDNDCDGVVDEEACGDPCTSDADCVSGELCVDGLCVAGCTDNDGDGYCDDDCDDSDPTINPGAAEICGDLIDNDCDGEVDEGCQDVCQSDADCAAGEICESGQCARPACCEDLEVAPAALDFGNVALGATATGTIQLMSVGGLDVTISEIAFERPDDAFMLDSVHLPVMLAPGQVLELTVLFVPYAEQSYTAALRIDSNDAEEPSLYVNITGAGGAGCQPEPELCDGLDNDCDGVVDEGDLCGAGQVCEAGACVPDEDCSPDLDGDGYCRDDCDDLDDTVYPGAAEICGDELDNDCDGMIDEGC